MVVLRVVEKQQAPKGLEKREQQVLEARPCSFCAGSQPWAL